MQLLKRAKVLVQPSQEASLWLVQELGGSARGGARCIDRHQDEVAALQPHLGSCEADLSPKQALCSLRISREPALTAAKVLVGRDLWTPCLLLAVI